MVRFSFEHDWPERYLANAFLTAAVRLGGEIPGRWKLVAVIPYAQFAVSRRTRVSKVYRAFASTTAGKYLLVLATLPVEFPFLIVSIPVEVLNRTLAKLGTGKSRN